MSTKWCIYIFLIASSSYMQALATENLQCGRAACKDIWKNFAYEEGQVYKYKYEFETKTTVQGTSPQETNLSLLAEISVHFHSLCDLTLEVNSAVFSSAVSGGSSDSEAQKHEELATLLTQHPLRIGFYDGRIREICPSPGESDWSLNVKRGLVSMFQNTMHRLDLSHFDIETDVTGTCPVHYDFQFSSSQGSSVTVKKTKDLNSCSDRTYRQTALYGVPYNFPGSSDSPPLINSSSYCTQQIDQKRLFSAECHETNLLSPFSYGSQGIVTTSVQKLTFVEEEKMEISPKPFESRRSLLFEHKPVTRNTFTSEANTLRALESLLDSTSHVVSLEASQHFTELVEQIKGLTYPEISKLLGKIDGHHQSKQALRWFWQGLIASGTSASMAALRDEAVSGSLPSDMTEAWQRSFAFLSAPTRDHLLAALPLLDLPATVRPPKIALSLSNLAHALCQRTSCHDIEEIGMLVKKIGSSLSTNCQVSSNEEADVSLALKSIGNIGHQLEGILPNVESCFVNPAVPMSLRIAALQSLRIAPCSINRQRWWDVFSDISLDSELRIQAYLGVIKCADYNIVRSVVSFLRNEPVKQVASFVYSHLRSAQTSSLPGKQNLQSLVADLEFETKFGNMNFTMYSGHYETSFHVDRINTGLGIESQLVFSQESFVPRSALVNLMVDFFGRSLNLFEVSGRTEGVETVLGKLFGPEGSYKDATVSDIVRTLRPKRRTRKDDVDASKVKAIDSMFKKNSPMSTSKIDFSVKILGNELYNMEWTGDKMLEDVARSLSPMSIFTNGLKKESSQLNGAKQFLDSAYVIPISVGLPLRVAAKGNALVDWDGLIDGQNMTSILRTGEGVFRWKFQPSASVQVEGSMAIETPVAVNGITLNLTLHSSVAVEGSVTLNGYRLIDVQFQMPRDKLEILNAKSSLILKHNEARIPIKGIQDNHKSHKTCIKGSLGTVLGLQLCSEWGFSNASLLNEAPWFPLTGPSQFHLTVLKTNNLVTGYRFLHNLESSKAVKSWALLVESQGSETKGLGVKTHLNFETGQGLLALTLPSATYELKGVYKYEDYLKELEAGFYISKRKIVGAGLHVKKQSSGKAVVYQPRAFFVYSDKRVGNVTGEIRLVDKKGTVRYDTDVQIFFTDKLSVGTKGYYMVDDKSSTTDFLVDYQWQGGKREKVKWEMKLSNQTTDLVQNYEVHVEAGLSAYPQYNVLSTWKYLQGNGRFENELKINSGHTVKNPHYQLFLLQNISYTSGTLSESFSMQLEASLPSRQLDTMLQFAYFVDDKAVDGKLDLRYTTGKEIKSSVNFVRTGPKWNNLNGAIDISTSDTSILKMGGSLRSFRPSRYEVTITRGLWLGSTDFTSSANFSSSGIVSATFDYTVEFGIVSSSFQEIQTASRFIFNPNRLLLNSEAKVGKNAFSVGFDYQHEDNLDYKVAVTLGYFNRMHFLTSHVNWKEGPNAQIHLHIDKVRDVHGEFGYKLQSRNRADWFAEFKWDANRDPLQRITLKGTDELRGENRNGTAVLTFPGHVARSHWTLLRSSQNKTILANVDWGEGPIEFSGTADVSESRISSSITVNTPFLGWETNKAVFRAERTKEEGTVMLTTHWGKSGNLTLLAQGDLRSQPASWSANARVLVTSSWENLSKVDASWKTEIKKGVVSNFFAIEKDLVPLIQVSANSEWDLANGLAFNSSLGFESFSSHLSSIKLELRHQTHLEDWISETVLATQINEQKYAVNLKGRAPHEPLPRCEVVATISTPHVGYEILGVIVDIVADEIHPVTQLQFAWPGKEISLLAKLDLEDDAYGGTLNVTTPFEALRIGHVALGHISDGYKLKQKMGLAWNIDNDIQLSWHSAFSHWQNFTFGGLITTSYPDHKAYGGEFQFEFSPSWPMSKVQTQARWADNQIGFGVMVEKEEHVSKASLHLELPQTPVTFVSVTLDQTLETVFEAAATCGDQEIRLKGGTSGVEDEKRAFDLSVYTSFEAVKQLDIKTQYLLKMEETPFLTVSAGVKWMDVSLNEKGGGLHLRYKNTVEEDFENFTTKSVMETAFEVKTPFALLQEGGMVVSNLMEETQITQSGLFYFKDYYIKYAGDIDLNGMAVTSLNWDKKNNKQQLRMNSTWNVGEDDSILIQGVLETPFRGYKKLPWTAKYSSSDGKSEDYNYQGDQEENGETEEYSEATPMEENTDWSKNVAIEVKLPQNEAANLNVEFKHGELILTATSPFAALKSGDVKILYSSNDGDYTASGSGTLNGETLEISATITPGLSGWIPTKIVANMLVPSNDLSSASLNWLRTVEESDELSSQSVSGSVAWNNKLIEINARTNSNTTSFIYDVALITPFVNYESWSTIVHFSQEEDYYAHVTLKTPFPALPTLSAFGRLKWMDYVTKVVLSVDTLNLIVRGELGGEWSPEVASALCKLVLESEPNDLKHNVELSLDYKTYEDKEDRTLQIVGLWNDNFDVKLNSKWVFQHWDTYLFFIEGHGTLTAAIGSYIDDEWTVKGLVDTKNAPSAYKHDVQYVLKSEGLKFYTYGNYERKEDTFNGKIGNLWSGNETPLELRINGEYLGKLLQSKLEIISPWTNLPISVDLQYDSSRPKTVFKVDLNCLGNQYALSSDMRYQGLMNMEGSVNLTTHHEAFSKLNIQVDTQEIAGTLNGTCRVDWNGGNHIDVHISHKSLQKSITLPINRDVQGLIQLTTSWSKLLLLQYNHKHLSPTERTSNLIFVYDEKEVVNTLYNIKEQSSAGKDKFEVNVEVRNVLFPIGVSYTRNFEYSGGADGLNLPTKLHKVGSIFGLEVKNLRRLTGEYIEITTITGQDYTFLVSSPSRTISLKTKYDFPDNWFRHSTEFRWRPDASVAYKIDIENRTRDTETEYLITTSFFTPVRNFGLLGSLLVNETTPDLRSVVAHSEAVWDLRRPDSTVKSSLQYDELPNAERKIVLEFGQGKLPHDVVIEASYVYRKPFIADPRVVVKYTTDPSRHLTLSGSSRLQTEADGSWVLQSYFNLSHPVTNWNIRFNSTQTVESELASSKMYLFYSRGKEEKVTIENVAYFDMDAPSFHIQTTTPWYKTRQSGQADLLGPVYKIDLQNQVNGSPPQKAELILNTLTPYLGAVMQYDPESVRGVHLQAVIPDKRTVSLALWHQEEEYRDIWLNSYVKLNHTRLLTLRTQWRTTLYSDGMEYWSQIWKFHKEQSVLLLKEAADRVFEETQAVLDAFLKDFNSVLKSPLQHLKKDLSSLAEDYIRVQQNVVDGYNDNAFYAKTIVEFTKEFIKEIPFSTYVDTLVAWAETAANKLAAIFVSSSDAFTRWLEEFRRQVKDGYDKFVQWLKTAIESWKNRPKFITETEWKETITAVLSKYRQALEDSGCVFASAVQEYWTNFSNFCEKNMQSLVETLRPTFLEIYNYVETTLWYTVQELLDFLYSQNEAMVSSPYYHKMMQFKEDLDIFYEDVMNSDWTTIWNKYYTKSLDFLQIKYQESGFSSLGIGKYLESWLKKALSHPDVKEAVEHLNAVKAQILWAIDYIDISDRISSGVSYLWYHAEEILTQTALEAANKHSEAKTKFILSPAKGIAELEQKLPFSWHAFDERPLFEEIPEVKSVLKIKELFQESNKTSLWEDMNSVWADVKMLSELELDLNSLSLPHGFLPPYRGTSIISGVNHILTFDGELLHLPSPSPCTYLLSRDVVTGAYTLTMKHVTTAKGKGQSVVLTLTIDEAPWEIDVSAQTVRVAGIERVLPTEERGTVAYYLNKEIVISSGSKGVLLVCGSSYETCVLTVSGWYFSRVAGLMGTLDNEPITDKVLPDRRPALNEKDLLDSWNISPAGVCEVPNLAPAVPSSELRRRCSSFFTSSRSVLRPCFWKVDPSPYLSICLNSGKKNGPEGCSAVAAYKEACENQRVTVPMPSNCMRCVMENGQSVPEDESKVFKSDKNGRSSADIVFVIEAKSCNEKARSKRNLNLLVTTVDKELNAKRITKNRFAVIAFGGESVNKGPLVRTYQGQEFVPSKDVDNLLNISTVKEPSIGSDVLSALAEAAKLKFRPGVARIVIALPCSSCDSVRSATDVDSVQRTFLGNDMSLHVIVNHEFRFSKVKIGKLFLGMDATAGFTRKDADGPIESALVGDTALRRQVRLPKSVLGSCTTLALNTNGSIFSGARLEEGRKEHVKKMVSVLGRKISQTVANVCQTCTCTSYLGTSEAFWQCSPCARKSLSSVDYSFLTDEISREERMVSSKGKKGSDKKKKPKETSTEDDDVNDSDEAE